MQKCKDTAGGSINKSFFKWGMPQPCMSGKSAKLEKWGGTILTDVLCSLLTFKKNTRGSKDQFP